MSQPTITAMPLSAPLIALAISQRVAFLPDPDADAWFTANELVGPDAGGVLALTERGQVWVNMLVETPLPVAVARWGDPRKAPGESAAALQIVDTFRRNMPSIGDMETIGERRANKSFSDIVPPGFTPNSHTDTLPGQVPPGMQRDTELEVVFRNGRVDKRGQHVKMFAAQVPWQRVGPDIPDAVIAYRIVQGEQLMVAGTSLTG